MKIIKLFFIIIGIFFLNTLSISWADKKQKIPNEKIDILNTYIKKNFEVQCKTKNNIQTNSHFICQKWSNINGGFCKFYIETNTEKENGFFCSLKDKKSGRKKTKFLDFSKANTWIIAEKIFFETIDRSAEFPYKRIQKQTYSCEISSTADILSSITGENIEEKFLLKKLAKSSHYNQKAIQENGKMIWGNPNKGFVWYIDTDKNWEKASQRKLTGYWVYEKPIADIYHQYGLKTKIINKSHYKNDFNYKKHLTELLSEFKKWNYVQIWWDVCTDPKEDSWEKGLYDITQADVDKWIYGKNNCWSFATNRNIEWNYQENGKYIQHRWLIWEHNFYLLWYVWSPIHPEKIILWDTATWKHSYSLKEFMRKWETMDYRSIIIYNQ